MKKAIEFNRDREDIKEYLEECLKETNIEYKIEIEGKWIQKYKNPSEYYEVYSIYVNENDLDKVKKFMNDFENATIITDDIEELKNLEDVEEEEEKENQFKIFNKKNLLKYSYGALIIIGILLIIGIKFFN